MEEKNEILNTNEEIPGNETQKVSQSSGHLSPVTSQKPVELRSEEVQEVLGEVPSWILRRGITVLFLIVLVLFGGSWFFKYPDIIEAPLTVTSYHPPVHINSRVNGKITRLLIRDKEEIKSGDYLAIIENPANIDDVYYLRDHLPVWMSVISDGTFHFDPEKFRQKYELGDMQQHYLGFLRTVNSYQLFTDLNYYPKRIEAIEEQIRQQEQYSKQLESQYELVKQQYALSHRQYVRDSVMNAQKMISEAEHDNAAISFLQSKHSLGSSKISLDNVRIQIEQLKQSILDLQLQELEKQNQLLAEIKTSFDNLQNGFNTWEMSYVLKSPVDGMVDISKYWNVNQNIVAGETIFTIIPHIPGELIGKALLPVVGSGKVKEGQPVNIRFLNFPDQEYGIVKGMVHSISIVPSGDSYIVEIGFPNGLMTSYGKELPFTQEMQATAEIITDDLRLLERLFMPVKKIFSGQQ